MKKANFSPLSIRHLEGSAIKSPHLELNLLKKRMSQHFGDLEGVETDIDDIIIHADTEVKHDHRLDLVLERCKMAYASRSFSDAESRYAQIEKELLAVQFSLERFNQYTYGKKVHVESHHKPLEATAPPRLQRILLRMQKYDYTLEYKPGKELVLPDMLSRAPLPETADDNNMEEEITLHVHLVRSSLPVSKPKLEEIREETVNDQSLRDLSEIIKCGWPETKSSVTSKYSHLLGCKRRTL